MCRAFLDCIQMACIVSATFHIMFSFCVYKHNIQQETMFVVNAVHSVILLMQSICRDVRLLVCKFVVCVGEVNGEV